MDALIVDDHPIVHEILREAIRKVFTSARVLSASDLEGAIDQAGAARDLALVVLDLGLPGCDGLDALHRFRDRYARPKVVIFSAAAGAPLIRDALRLGASGFIPKTSTPNLLVAALQLVKAGGHYVPIEALEEDRPADRKLTQRQAEVLALMAKGLSNRAVAAALGIAEATVKQHVTDIFHALGVPNREAAVAIAKRVRPGP